MNVGEKIKAARLKKGYTQEELGKMIGVQKSAVAKYENGRVVNIKRSVLQELSQILEIPPVELVADINKDPKKSANELADIMLDIELMEMLKEYNQLNNASQKEARNYVHYLLEKQLVNSKDSVQKGKNK